MKVIKPQLLGVLHRTFEHDQRHYFVVTILAAFRLTTPRSLVQEVLLWKAAGEELGRDGVLELGMSKQRGELLVTGRAYAQGGPQPAVAVRVKIASVDKTLHVIGDRYWERNGSTPPRPFVEMPVSWSNAFGGDKSPENPLGKGIATVEVDGEALVPLPNVEDPRHLVRSASDRPTPAGFGPMDLLWPQRFAKMGTYDAAWSKELMPGLARDLDWSVFNCAPADQWIDGYFRGDEAFSVEHMHPERPVFDGALPGYAGRAFIRQTNQPETLREIATRIDTVHLFPHRDLGMLVFRGMVQVSEDDASDVTHLLVACEDAASPRTLAHYAATLERRLQKKRGALESLVDADLVPGEQPSPFMLSRELDPEIEISGSHLRQKNRRRGLEREHERVRRALMDKGIDPAIHLAELPPAVDFDAPVDDILARHGALMTDLATAKEQARQARGAQTESARKKLADRGLDLDHQIAEGKKRSAGPPKDTAAPKFAAARALVARANAEGYDASAIVAVLEKVEPVTRVAHARALEGYRRNAQHFPEASALGEASSAEIRIRIELGAAQGVSFRDCDFTGADLRGLVAPGADLAGAFLEGANLVGADLTGASLVETVLVRADLTGATLERVSARGVNLAHARLARTDLRGARLAHAVLTGASFEGTRLDGAQLENANLLDASFVDCDLSQVSAPRAKFIKNVLARARFVGANLERALFVENDLRGADFSGANLERASFVTVDASGSRFVGAQATHLRVAKDTRFDDCDFSSATLTRANLRMTGLARAVFTGARLDDADLSGCEAPGAIFARVRARKARFMGSNLQSADLSRIDLLGGSLMKADIRGASFAGANLFAVDFARSVGDSATSMKGANVKRVRVTPKRPDGSG